MKKSKRKIAYLLIIAVILSGVAARIRAVIADRAEPIVSFSGQWFELGKPVHVQEIEAADIPVYSQFTVRMVDDRVAEGFVTGAVKDTLSSGQEIYDTEDKTVACAKVGKVSGALDIDTGMFPVELEFYDSRTPGVFLVVCAHTSTFRGALVVPNEVLDIVEGDYYIWKAQNGAAKKYKVTVGSRNGYGAVITQGLHSGDAVVFRGQSGLADGDKLFFAGSGGLSATGKTR